MRPAATKLSSRAVRMFGATPRLRWKSPKRLHPANRASRMISRLQRSPTSSRARAAEQFWESYVRPSMVSFYHPYLHHATTVCYGACMMQVHKQVEVSPTDCRPGFRDTRTVRIYQEGAGHRPRVPSPGDARRWIQLRT